jgi:hypothetical protein
MHRRPHTTVGEGGREWVHPEELEFFLYQDKKTLLWCIIFRTADLAVTKQYKTKRGAVGAFMRSWKVSGGNPPFFS